MPDQKMTEDSTKKISNKAGLPPGALIHVGRRKVEHVKISVIEYDVDHFSELKCEAPLDCLTFKESNAISWINIDGLHDPELIDHIGKQFSMHPLLIEDILNTHHRPKMEEYKDHLFITLKMLGINNNRNGIVSEQISIVLGHGWLLSFQEQEGDIFDNLRLKIKEGKGLIREMKADHLLYRLIDTVVDHYFFVTEFISDTTESLEQKVLKQPDSNTLLELQQLKNQLIKLRKAVTPLREAVAALQRDHAPLIEVNTTQYIRDVYEHIIHVNENIETQRDMLASIMDLYLSGVSNRMNKVMQMLTIIATIFIPLTFIAGVYGMNFDNMPELHWKYGYLGVMTIMFVIFALMIVYFKRKDWL